MRRSVIASSGTAEFEPCSVTTDVQSVHVALATLARENGAPLTILPASTPVRRECPIDVWTEELGDRFCTVVKTFGDERAESLTQCHY